MDQLESTDITFGAGDIDGLGFPSSDDHIAASGGHGLQTEISGHADPDMDKTNSCSPVHSWICLNMTVVWRKM